MRQGTLALVRELQENDQDFEFYPTKKSDVQIIIDDIKTLKKDFSFTERHSSSVKLLDVGAGDGRILNWVKEAFTEEEYFNIDPYAIEKATVHTSTYRKKGITLIGTDFNQVNFISKKCDICFVNPPYTQFKYWLETLLMHLSFGILYAVIPKRWEQDESIKEAMKIRGVKFSKVLAESDFLDGERAARAKVHIVRFSFNELNADDIKHTDRRYHTPNINKDATDPFQIFIEQELNLKKTYSETTNKFSEYEEKERIRQSMATEGSPSFELVESRGILWALLDKYEIDLAKTLGQYKLISKIDAQLLQELGIDYDALRKGAKEKLLGYRNVYWSLLFEKLDTISDRLTSKHKKSLLNQLSANNLDFTYTNAVYVISYAVEVGNELIENSLIDVFKDLTSPKAISRYYKSNDHVYSDDWRYSSYHGDPSKRPKYLLDYRFIHSSHGNFGHNSWDKGLNESARGHTSDLMVAFKLLGYANIYSTVPFSHMSGGDSLSIMGTDPNGEIIELVTIRFYLNGNKHHKFNALAMLRMNCTCSRILGWVRSKEEFVDDSETTEPVDDSVWEISEEMKVQTNNILLLTSAAA